MQQNTTSLLNIIEKSIRKESFGHHPIGLYEPIRYIMSLGGKRMRPLFVLLAYNCFKDDIESIIKPAIAVEIFHNFTLIHDDIMDQSPMRRGLQTVHEKWNINTAILSGDVMLIKAYNLLLQSDPKLLQRIFTIFNGSAIKVCEGQQLDMDFEQKKSVSKKEYIEMIQKKTGELLGMSLKIGSILAHQNEKTCNLMMDFGLNVGIGFQLMDDLLDVFGDKNSFGKQIGRDIISNKKTYLNIHSFEKAEGKLLDSLKKWSNATKFDPNEKVKEITDIYTQLEIKTDTISQMNKYFEKAFDSLSEVECCEKKKGILKKFTLKLMKREN